MQVKKRIVSALLTAVLFLQLISGAAAIVLPDQKSEDIYDGALSSLTSSVGTWNQAFSAEKYNYTLILGPQDKEKWLVTLEAKSRFQSDTSAPEITFTQDGSELKPTGENGRKKATCYVGTDDVVKVVITVTPKQGSAVRTYTVTIYRTASALSADCVVTTMADGSRQLTVALKVAAVDDGGLRFNSLSLALGFDPKKLQLANVSNQTTTSLGEVVVHASNFLYDSTYASSGVFDVNSTLNNNKGQLVLQYSATSSGRSYTAAEEATLLTVRFRLAEDAVLDSGALWLDTGNGSVSNGVIVGILPAGYEGNAIVTNYDGLLTFSGLTRVFIRPVFTQSEAGGLSVSPDQAEYGYGAQIALTAVPASGFSFSHWEVSEEQKAFLGDQDLTGGTLRVQLLDEPIYLSTLTPVFERLDLVLPSGYGLDFSAPYDGEQMSVYAPASGGTQRPSGGFGEREDSAAEEQEDGLVRVEIQESLVLDGTENVLPESAAELAGEETLEVGVTTKTFRVRDYSKNQISSEGWADGAFRLRAIEITGGTNLYIWTCETEGWTGTPLTDDELSELAVSFADSYATLAEQFQSVTDTNGNGGLDILMYDIHDSYGTSNAYTGGFINPNEFYGSSSVPGNTGDVLHLDTYPQLGNGINTTAAGMKQVMSTMAHETQHLVMASTFETAAKFSEAMVPDWINEGLSLTVEDALFGTLDSRISYYNSSTSIKNGHSLTTWGGDTLSNYALSYLFFQYVKSQSGDAEFAKKFYCSYGNDPLGTLTTIVDDYSAFEGMDADDVIECFYLALLLQEDEGLYGFPGASWIDAVKPQTLSVLPGTLAAGAAVYVDSEGRFTPDKDTDLRYTGITTPSYILTVGAAEGGSAGVSNGQSVYPAGSTATITATADPDWEFSYWLVDGAAAGSDNPLVLCMDGEHTVTPVFQGISRYSVSISTTGGGTVSVTDASGQTVEDLTALAAGTRLTLTAHPEPGYIFQGWSDSYGAQTEITLRVNSALNLTATFREALPVSVESIFADENAELRVDPESKALVVVVPDQGEIQIDMLDAALDADMMTVPEGALVRMTAMPAQGKAFSHWEKITLMPDESSKVEIISESASVLTESGSGTGGGETVPAGRVLVVRIESGVSYRAVYTDQATLTESDLLLANLTLVNPDGRGLLPTGGDKVTPGFASDITQYDLYLRSTETEVTFHAVKSNDAAMAEMGLYRAEQLQGSTQLIPSGQISLPDGDTVEKPSVNLKDLVFTGLQDGDELRITVNDGSSEPTLTKVYVITIHLSDLERDPKAQVELEHTDDAWTANFYLQNVKVSAVDVRLDFPQGALRLLNKAGETISAENGVFALDDLQYTTAEGYRLEKASLIEVEAGVERLTLTFGMEKALQYQELPFKMMSLPFRLDLGIEGSWTPQETTIAYLYDSSLLQLALFDVPVTVKQGGVSLTGGFQAYASGQEIYTGEANDAYQVYLKSAESITPIYADVVTAADEETVEPYGLHTFQFQFDQSVPAGTYNLVICKPGHAMLTVKGIQVLDGDVELSGLLGQTPTLTVGDVDGDGRVTALDRAMLTDTTYYGQLFNGAYDLDGDGAVLVFDVLLLESNFGKGDDEIEIPKTQSGGSGNDA